MSSSWGPNSSFTSQKPVQLSDVIEDFQTETLPKFANSRAFPHIRMRTASMVLRAIARR